jgi:hypothetical protein
MGVACINGKLREYSKICCAQKPTFIDDGAKKKASNLTMKADGI